MQFGSVCSGIEAASIAWAPLGWKAAWLAEIEPFPCAVLAHHYPSVPNLGDMTKIAAMVRSGAIEAPDVFCGGTPCQAFSVAGLRKSLDDARGNLSLTFCEIANEIDAVRSIRGEQPSIIFWENVPGVLSTKDNAFGCFLAGLAGEDDPLVAPGGKWTNAGCVYGPKRAVAWRVFDAQFFGVAQRRRRVFVVASARKGFDPAQVLFEWDGVRRDTAPSREARQVAPTIPARSTAGGGLGTDFDCDGGLIEASTHRMVAFGEYADDGTASAMKARDYKDATDLVAQTAHTLRGDGFDASEDGTGRSTPLVPALYSIMPMNSGRDYKAREVEVAQPLMAGGPVGGNQGGDVILQPVALDTTQVTSAANRSNPQPGDPCHPLAAGAHAPAIAFPANLSGTQCASTEEVASAIGALNPTAVAFQERFRGDDGRGYSRPPPVSTEHIGTLETVKPWNVATAMQVRRLTPTEAERLMGFPDGYTAIPWRKKPASECPDGPRYRSLGNSWAVPNVAWIGRRIHAALHKT